MKEIIELIKALAWPLIVTLLIVFNWSPVRDTFKLLPQLISNSKSISIAGLSIEINQKLERKSTPEIKKSLMEISTDGIDLMLYIGDSHWVLTEQQYAEYGADKYGELLHLGLAVKSNKPNEVDISLSEQGHSVRRYLIELIDELIKEAEK